MKSRTWQLFNILTTPDSQLAVNTKVGMLQSMSIDTSVTMSHVLLSMNCSPVQSVTICVIVMCLCHNFLSISGPSSTPSRAVMVISCYKFVFLCVSPFIPFTQYKSEVPQEAPADQEEADLQRALALRFDLSYDIKAFILYFALTCHMTSKHSFHTLQRGNCWVGEDPKRRKQFR